MRCFSAVVAFVLAFAFGFMPHAESFAAEPPGPVSKRLQPFAEQQTVAGCVTLVAQQGKIISLDAVGLADLDGQRPMRPDTLFWIASMTKPVTAAAVMMLQDEGKLSINDPAGKYIPEFREVTLAAGGSPARAVTLRDLLTHTSGVDNPAADSLGPNATLGEIAVAIAKRPLQFEPGSQWKYGSGLTVAGRIVEIVSGKSFDGFLEERIFQPLQMKDTTFYPTAEQRQRLATIYRGNAETRKLELLPGALNTPDESRPRRAPNPSGGLCSSASDYFRFFQMVLNGGELEGQRILSAAAVRQMTTVHTGDLKAGFSPGTAWGLGWGVVQQPMGLTASLSPDSHGHGGAFGTQAWVDPHRRAVFVFMIARSDVAPVDEQGMRAGFLAAAVEQLK